MDAMLLAAGRGERMRPLSDRCPKPLLEVSGKPLIVWQIEALAQAGFRRLVINHAWLGQQLEQALGDGHELGVRIRWSPEAQALGTAGGVVQALHLLEGPAFVVASADIHTDFDYGALLAAGTLLAALAGGDGGSDSGSDSGSDGCGDEGSASITGSGSEAGAGRASGHGDLAHLVLVDDQRVRQDFDLAGSRVIASAAPTLTYGNIGVLRRELFAGLVPGHAADLGQLLRAAVAAGRVSGQRHGGRWDNVGTPSDLARVNAWRPDPSNPQHPLPETS